MSAGANIVSQVVEILSWIIIVDAVLTWLPQVNRSNPLVVALRRITTPIYRPIRRLIPPEKTGYIDFSPVVAIVGLRIIGMIV
jgi:YggT family protein